MYTPCLLYIDKNHRIYEEAPMYTQVAIALGFDQVRHNFGINLVAFISIEYNASIIGSDLPF